MKDLDFDNIEARALAFADPSLPIYQPTVVNINLGPNVTANDVAAIIASAPPGAHFLMHSDAANPWVGSATKSMAQLADQFVKLSKINDDFKAEYLATNLTQPKPITYGPQRTTRKGKVKRW